MNRLQNKTAIVTGGASGFGAAIATEFAAQGAHVCIADLNIAAAQQLAQTLTAQGKVKAIAVACDVSKQDHVQHLVQTTVAQLGKLDIVVNNAGITHPNASALEIDEAAFDRVFNVNVKSLFWMSKAVAPVFTAAGGGVMVNVSSITGVRPGPGLCWYSASKAAVINATKGLAQELASKKIRVCAINPMIGETAMMEQFMGVPDTPENRQKFLARIPLGRFTKPNDVAQAAVYLASDEAAFLTGTCLDVDGGRNI